MTLAELRSARLRGLRPSERVFLSMLGEISELNAIPVTPQDDLRTCIGLDVVVVFRSSQVERALDLCDGLLGLPVAGLDLWDIETRRCKTVVVGCEKHISEVCEPCG